MDFEERVKESIRNYGAQEEVLEIIYNFLIDSGNAYTIGELYKECFASRETVLHQKNVHKPLRRMRK